MRTPGGWVHKENLWYGRCRDGAAAVGCHDPPPAPSCTKYNILFSNMLHLFNCYNLQFFNKDIVYFSELFSGEIGMVHRLDILGYLFGAARADQR